MAKIEKATDDVVKLFHEIRDKTTIPQWIQFEVLCNNKQKELYKIVKTNDIVEILTDGINFAVVFNEEILEQMPDDMKEMAIVECLAGVSVSESDVVSLEKPNFNTHTGVLQKYGHEPIIVLHESIKSFFDSKKQKEDEEKAQKKAKRSKKQ
jgi:rRNA processing protein Krr1/Pno1